MNVLIFKSQIDFKTKLKEIKNNHQIHDKDKELALWFKDTVNPYNIIDGHCASCAFNTHICIAAGKNLQEAKAPGSSGFKKFGDWFYKHFNPTIFREKTIEVEECESLEELKLRVEQVISQVVNAGEGALISIGEGSHWFNTFNDGDKIWFIDSQGGKGFNVYSYDEKPMLGDTMELVLIDADLIKDSMVQIDKNWET